MAAPRARVRGYGRRFHPVGLGFALVFFVWSLTPSLLPRVWYLQGVPAGFGHAYGPEAAQLWADTLTPDGWDDAATHRVQNALAGTASDD
ncbi:alpha/beta-hydrolase N-terminal domain-containing protein [Rhodococcus sp. 2H158]|nr:hypothetical protein GQ85_22940 [Rhodococcus rhodochrous]